MGRRVGLMLFGLMLATTVAGASEEPFTEQEARAQAVVLRESATIPGLVEGIDVTGRVVWTSSSEGTWGLRHDAQGRVAEMVDAEGNSTRLTYDSAGCRIETAHHRTLAGDWRERELCTAAGEPVATVVDEDSGSLGDIDAKLLTLGIDAQASPAPPSVGHEVDGSGRTIEFSAAYATASTWLPADAVTSTVLARERTEVGGVAMTVEAIREEDAVLVKDDWGGWRREVSGDGGLESVVDAAGRVIEIQRDELGRPVEILLGELFALRYAYGDATPQWLAKTVVDLRDGSQVFAWSAASKPGEIAARAHEVPDRPRPNLRVLLSGHGAVAEWDPRLYPDGVGVIGFAGAPYALIPFDLEGGPLYSLSLFEPEAAWSWDRIDYDDQTLALHLLTDAATKETAPVTVLLSLPRHAEVEAVTAEVQGPGNGLAAFSPLSPPSPAVLPPRLRRRSRASRHALLRSVSAGRAASASAASAVATNT